MTLALVNGRILTDEGFLEDRMVLIEDGRIKELGENRGARPGADRIYDMEGNWLLPGFIDTQVNGGGGVLFNDDPSVDSIVEIGRAHRRYGTTGFLPTLISDDLHIVSEAVHAVQKAIEIAMPSVGAPNKAFKIQGRPISVADNMCIDEDGRLAGSDIDMATAVRNAPDMLDVELPEAAKMASQYPAEFLGLGRELGRIAPGYRADLVLVDESVNVIETWIGGKAPRG